MAILKKSELDHKKITQLYRDIYDLERKIIATYPSLSRVGDQLHRKNNYDDIQFHEHNMRLIHQIRLDLSAFKRFNNLIHNKE